MYHLSETSFTALFICLVNHIAKYFILILTVKFSRVECTTSRSLFLPPACVMYLLHPRQCVSALILFWSRIIGCCLLKSRPGWPSKHSPLPLPLPLRPSTLHTHLLPSLPPLPSFFPLPLPCPIPSSLPYPLMHTLYPTLPHSQFPSHSHPATFLLPFPPFPFTALPHSQFPSRSHPAPFPLPSPTLLHSPFPPLPCTIPPFLPYPAPFPLPSPTLLHSPFPSLPCPIPSSLRYKITSLVIRSFANTIAEASNSPHLHHPFYYSLHFLLLSSTFTMSRYDFSLPFPSKHCYCQFFFLFFSLFSLLYQIFPLTRENSVFCTSNGKQL